MNKQGRAAQKKRSIKQKKSKPAVEDHPDTDWRRHIATDPLPDSLRQALGGTWITLYPGLGNGPTSFKLTDEFMPPTSDQSRAKSKSKSSRKSDE